MICAKAADAVSTLEIRVRGPGGEEASRTVQLTPDTNMEEIELFLPSGYPA